jgi:hypothetical protein
MWVVPIAGSTGSALRAVRPPNLHITPDAQRDLFAPQASPWLRLRVHRLFARRHVHPFAWELGRDGQPYMPGSPPSLYSLSNMRPCCLGRGWSAIEPIDRLCGDFAQLKLI